MDPEKTKKVIKEQSCLEKEILQEIAEALGNSGARLEEILIELNEISSEIEKKEKFIMINGASEEDRRDLLQMIERFNSTRKIAIERFRNLIIHREAVGFRKHDHMFSKYHIPPIKKSPF
jgi:hypothetical protein